MSFIIKNIFNNTKELIKDNFVFFLNLIAINALLILGMALFSQWIEENVDIFNFQIGAIILRVSLFVFFEGVTIGYIKLILNFINKQPFQLTAIFKHFYLIPKYIVLQLIYYCTMLPSFIFVLYKFPYSITDYGTNFNQYIMDIMQNVSTAMADEITWQLSFAFFNTYDIIILSVLSVVPIIYILHFWCAQLLIIDKNYSIYQALHISYQIARPVKYTFYIILLLVGIATISMFLGMIFFPFALIGLTMIYIIMIQYYKYLLNKI